MQNALTRKCDERVPPVWSCDLSMEALRGETGTNADFAFSTWLISFVAYDSVSTIVRSSVVLEGPRSFGLGPYLFTPG